MKANDNKLYNFEREFLILLKGEVHSISFHISNERSNNMNTHTGKGINKKCHGQKKQLCVYLLFLLLVGLVRSL